MKKNNLKVCYFGTYERKYSRNETIKLGLYSRGIKIIECSWDIWEGKEHKSKISKINFLIKLPFVYLYLFLKYFLIEKHDIIFVPYPGHIDVFIAKLLSILKKKPLVFDAFLSLYDSMVNDRKIVKKKSLLAKFLYFIDKYSCKLADIVLLDTMEHIKYFSRELNIKKEKFRRVWIGANEKIFYPRKVKKYDKFTVVFHGKFIPLQGIDNILYAAKFCKDINFKLIGDGQLYEDMVSFSKKLKLENVEFLGFMEKEQIAIELSKAHIGLGIFGTTDKAKRVIPNKAYEVMAVGLPLITGNSPAAREILVNKKHCILCKMGSGKAIANAILLLKNNEKLRKYISVEGHKLFSNLFSTEAIGKLVEKIILELL